MRSEWGLGLWCLDHKYGPPPAALRGPARLGRREVRAMACFVLRQLQQWVDNREGGQEFRAQAIPSPLGVPRTGNRMSSEGGISGEEGCPSLPRPRKERFLVCSLRLLFQETQAYGSGWCGGRVWVVYMLAFCMVECIFYRLQHPAGTQGSETCVRGTPPASRNIHLFSSGGSGVSSGEGIGELSGNPGLSFAEVLTEDCVSRS